MPEIVYGYSLKNDKTYGKLVVDDSHLVINHIVMPMGEGLPDHLTNSNVYILMTKEELTIHFEKQRKPHLHHGPDNKYPLPFAAEDGKQP